MKTILSDIHGTILEKDTDTPIKPTIDLINTLGKTYRIVVVTGRNLKQQGGDTHTIAQLKNAGLNYDDYIFNDGTYDLDGLDENSDEDEPKVKERMIKQWLDKNFDTEIVFAIDNSKRCRKMYKNNQINTLKPKMVL